MKKLYRVYVEREDDAELYVEAESPEEAKSKASDVFDPAKWWPNNELIFNDPNELAENAVPWSKPFPVLGIPGDLTVEDWWKERAKRAATQGTEEYREAVEAAGQMTIGEG